MMFKLLFTKQASADLEHLEKKQAKQFKAVRKALAYLQINPRHQSLHTHKYASIEGENGEPIFEAYAENHTPGAYRIFWHYGPNPQQLTIIAILLHRIN